MSRNGAPKEKQNDIASFSEGTEDVQSSSIFGQETITQLKGLAVGPCMPQHSKDNIQPLGNQILRLRKFMIREDSDMPWDSKKETGYVGLKYQGEIFYMNSLLQSLYHIPYFRKAVYHMPTAENDDPTRSVPFALQNLFYKLQYHDRSVATTGLIKPFIWDAVQYACKVHHVQDLNRDLYEKLEDRMKGTVVEGTTKKLFEGHQMYYNEFVNTDFNSTKKEPFNELLLDVEGCKDVYASLDKYVEVYFHYDYAEGHGWQDAKEGLLFVDFPPVLQLLLRRFTYDFASETTIEINDRYEFPIELDLDKYMSPEADRSVRYLYTLHSVLVHCDSSYHAFIRPGLSEKWYKFDDERVTRADVNEAVQDQYGSEEELQETNPCYEEKLAKSSNAYMLVYIRVSDKDEVMCDVDEKDIAEHLRVKMEDGTISGREEEK